MDLEEQKRLAQKGMRDAINALLEQGIYSLNLGGHYQVELAGVGFTAEMLAAMSGVHTALSTKLAERREGQVDAQLATGAEMVTLLTAKAFIHKLRLTLPIATRGVKLDDLKPEHVAPKGTLGKSTPKVVGYLKANRKLIERVDEKLKTYFGGQSALATLDSLVEALDEAQGKQTTAKVSLSPETFEFYALKGELLEMIEDLNRLGRVAFMGRAEIASKFNKDILLRARRRRARLEEPEEKTDPGIEAVPA